MKYKSLELAPADADYLQSLHPVVPPFGHNISAALVGSNLAVVCYSLSHQIAVTDDDGTTRVEMQPVVWYAQRFSRVGMSKAIRIFHDISGCVGVPAITVILEGRDVFSRELVKHQTGPLDHPVRLLNKAGHRPIDLSELHLAVMDDISEGVIHIAPEFRPRVEFEVMNAEMDEADFLKPTTAMQQAFTVGLGVWSYKRKRPPYQIGAAKHRLW